ncbi:hypothetical protein Tco_0021843 [Tanacetum coccineum]
MRPLGCLLTILNTLDSLGKFDGKSDECYLLGYSASSKAFRVYNKRTKRTRILVEDVAPAAYEKSSESSPKDNDVQDSEDVADKEGQHQMIEDEQLFDASTLPNADLPIDQNMHDLEDDSDAFSNDDIFNGVYDDENVGAVADYKNMDDTINVSPIPTLRIHKDHPKDQILGDPKSTV